MTGVAIRPMTCAARAAHCGSDVRATPDSTQPTVCQLARKKWQESDDVELELRPSERKMNRPNVHFRRFEMVFPRAAASCPADLHGKIGTDCTSRAARLVCRQTEYCVSADDHGDGFGFECCSDSIA
jgi:hypothetical protein